MKILVIDDSQIHQAAARAQLSDHEVIVVGSYDEGQKLLLEKNEFEAVLVDLLMPASRQQQGPEGTPFVGQEMPIGIFLALLAAKNGAKYVAVFTDSNHHSHPASACFDAFNDGYEAVPFAVEGAKFILCNDTNWVNLFEPGNLVERVNPEVIGYKEFEKKRESCIRAKNWRKLLDFLLAL